MDAAYVSALSALAGSAIGAMASFATTSLTQHSQERATLLVQDRARREALYGEFIREASTLFGEAFQHDLDDSAKLARLTSPHTRTSRPSPASTTPATSTRSVHSRRFAVGNSQSPGGEVQCGIRAPAAPPNSLAIRSSLSGLRVK